MPTLRLDTACFLSILFETFFFGFYTLLFIAALKLLNSGSRGRVPFKITIIITLLYLVAAAHLILTVEHGSVGFISIASQGGVDAAIHYFQTTVNGVNIANHCLYLINNVLGDSVLIWRCWIVWGRDWRVIVVPVLLLCSSSVTGSMVAYNFSISKDGPFSKKLNIVATMFFTSVFLTNIIVTCLTAWKIWRFRRRTDLGNSKDYAGALNIVVESGMVYSAILAMEICLYSLGANFIFVLYTSMAQITGIAPTGIIVLVLLGRTLRHTPPASSGGTGTIDFRGNRSRRRDESSHAPQIEVPLEDTTQHARAFRVDIPGISDFGEESSMKKTIHSSRTSLAHAV